jgi:hypothetical protein
VHGDYVIRLNNKITEESVERLNVSFVDILQKGQQIQHGETHPSETDHVELPRLIVPHKRRSFGRLRQLIDMVNICDFA